MVIDSLLFLWPFSKPLIFIFYEENLTLYLRAALLPFTTSSCLMKTLHSEDDTLTDYLTFLCMVYLTELHKCIFLTVIERGLFKMQ